MHRPQQRRLALTGQQQHLVGIAQRQVQVVQHHDHAQAIAAGALAHQGHGMVLVLQVQRGRGFIQQQPAAAGLRLPLRRDLRQRPRQLHPGTLPARQRGQRALRQARHAGGLHAVLHDGRLVRRGVLAVGVTPHFHHLLHGEGKRQLRVLVHHRHAPRALGSG